MYSVLLYHACMFVTIASATGAKLLIDTSMESKLHRKHAQARYTYGSVFVSVCLCRLLQLLMQVQLEILCELLVMFP